jgi:hypothetical protein
LLSILDAFNGSVAIYFHKPRTVAGRPRASRPQRASLENVNGTPSRPKQMPLTASFLLAPETLKPGE